MGGLPPRLYVVTTSTLVFALVSILESRCGILHIFTTKIAILRSGCDLYVIFDTNLSKEGHPI